jgi:hypothetical protein
MRAYSRAHPYLGPDQTPERVEHWRQFKALLDQGLQDEAEKFIGREQGNDKDNSG